MGWSKWSLHTLEVISDGTLIATSASSGKKLVFDISKLFITHLTNNVEAGDGSARENGLLLSVRRLGQDTQLRFIVEESEIVKIYSAVRIAAHVHNLDNLRQGSITDLVRKDVGSGTQSIMRKSIARAIESFDSSSRKGRIIARRGALRWLPALMANDLVYGSW